jgi:hypothetical protein
MIPVKKRFKDYIIEISHGYDFEKLEKLWLSVQQSQDLPFFLTWSWVSCWIKTYDPEIVVVSAKLNNTTVAIGLFTCSSDRRHGFIHSRQYRLHQMGDPLLDQIWMEYNDFICIEKYRVEAVNACLKVLQQSESDWDEIILSMITTTRAAEIHDAIKDTHILLSSPCYSNNLDDIRSRNSSYLATLNTNTRYQISRSTRLYQHLHGEIGYRFAGSVEEALAFFHEAGKYHILRWKDSGYNNKQFVLFHENLIKNSKSSNSVDLMKITSGDTTIAILYFHLVGRDVYFYLQGINYEANKKLKPGLVAHAIATQYYLDKGMRKYDYMGGYSQYKHQLSRLAGELVTLCIQRPSLLFSIEKIGRKLKHLLPGIARQESGAL